LNQFENIAHIRKTKTFGEKFLKELRNCGEIHSTDRRALKKIIKEINDTFRNISKEVILKKGLQQIDTPNV